MDIKIEIIKQLRDETGAGVMDAKRALEESGGDFEKAAELLKAKGIEKAEKKEGRETNQGLVETYVHATGKIGVLVALACETDFVARTDEFKNLAHNLALQVASMEPKDLDELLKQQYIKDAGVTIEELIKGVIAKTGENIKIVGYSRLTI